MGTRKEPARASVYIVNYEVREAISAAERAAARSVNPEMTFTSELNRQVLGPEGLRNRYLGQADSARGTADITGPMTSLEQSSILSSGRLDRKSVGEGKSVSVRVDLGGPRIIKKKINDKHITYAVIS